MIVRRITEGVELPAAFPHRGVTTKPLLFLDRDEPGAQDHGKRCAHGYVTLSLSGADEGVFMISALRRALDEFERVETA